VVGRVIGRLIDYAASIRFIKALETKIKAWATAAKVAPSASGR
jgi:hypothetical protein